MKEHISIIYTACITFIHYMICLF